MFHSNASRPVDGRKKHKNPLTKGKRKLNVGIKFVVDLLTEQQRAEQHNRHHAIQIDEKAKQKISKQRSACPTIKSFKLALD